MSAGLDAEIRAPNEPGVSGFRYPGSPPFQDTALDRKLFWGRARESDTVLHSVLSSNLFVLYAVSGLGKSSLLNAGVMHRLRERGHWPVSVRLNDPSKPLVAQIREQIEAAARADPSIELVRDPSVGFEVDDSSLWDMLAPLEVWKRNDLQQLVVIFDQFEELFTLGGNASERQRLIAQFGEVVRGFRLDGSRGTGDDEAEAALPPRVRFVIVIREDSLGELEALASDVPQILQNRFRLGPLDLAQADAAIREPAMLDDERLGSQRFAYTVAAASVILDFLRTRTLRGTVVHTDDAVDPSQLQIVCQYIERAIVPGKRPSAPGEPVEIDDGDLGGREGLARILGHFYQRTLQTFPAAEQHAVRNLCEKGLINKSRRRLSLEEDEIGNTYGVSSTMLDQLVAERLLRAEPRLDSVYFELSHDTLVDPILSYRDQQLARTAQRRRRWIAGGVLAAGVLAIGGLLVFALRSAKDSRPPTITLGDEVSGSVKGGSSAKVFTLAGPADGVVLLTVTPEAGAAQPVDLAVEVTSSAVSSGQQNRFGEGDPEHVVASAVPGAHGSSTVRVSALNSASGSFAIAAEALEVTDLTEGATAGRIAEPGGLAVYRLHGERRAPTVVVVTPTGRDSRSSAGTDDSQSQKDPKQPPALDLEIEVIDPSGNRSPYDSAGPGEAERLAVGSQGDGEYLVVVRGYQTTVGTFSVDQSQVSGTLVPGETLDAEVSSSSPVVFGFDATGSDAYIAHVLSDDDLDAVLEVQGPSGTALEVDSAGPGEQEDAVLAGTEGYHVLSVSGFERSKGTFSIELEPVPLRQLAVGGSASAAAKTMFEVAVEPGQYVEFQAEPASEDDGGLDVTVLDQDGFPLDPQSAPDLGGPTTVALDGAFASTYRVLVDAQGEYEASATAVAVAPLGVGESAASDQSHVFDLTVGPESTRAVVVVPSGGFNPVVTVSGPSEFAAVADDGGAGEVETLVLRDVAPGTYRVVVTGEDSSTGDFEIAVTEATPVTLEVGEPTKGTLRAPGQVGLYELRASGEPALRIVMTATAGWAPVLRVTDPSGDPVGPGSANSLVISEPEADATYDVLVTRSSAAGGDFSLSVTAPDVIDLIVGSKVTVPIASPIAIAVYGLEVPAGATLEVSAVPSAGLDVAIDVHGPSGSSERADDAPAGGAERLAISGGDFEGGSGEAGPYQIVIAGDGSSTGEVELSFTGAQPVALGAGETTSGTVANPTGLYSVQASTGKLPEVVVTPRGGLDVALQATDPAGQVVGSVDGAGADGQEVLVVPALQAGTYQIQISGSHGSTGDFDVSVTERDPVTVTVGGTTHAALDAGEAELFLVDVPTDVPLTVRVTPTGGLDPVVQALDPVGSNHLADDGVENDREVLEIPPVEAGRYLILVSAFGTTTGDFELDIASG